MAIRIKTAAFTGIKGMLVSVEVDITKGLPNFTIVGLADTSVKESKERVRSAIINSGYEFPLGRITVNLAPADLRKEGTHFDLPIAIGILIATGQISFSDAEQYLFLGELSLFGELKKVKGALPITLEGQNQGVKGLIVPTANARECSAVKNASIYPFTELTQVVHFMQYQDLRPYKEEWKASAGDSVKMNYNEIIGQESAKRALEIAAAGGHNILMYGSPGSGKTMLANRIPSILPPMTYEEAVDVTKIYSVSGKLGENEGLITERPFRNPHHTSSRVALVGGGNALTPGEVSLAHHGVLFLDEMLEFKKSVLEVLRQPLENKVIEVSRCSGTVHYPADFILAAALNPCPCGYYGSSIKDCTCSEYERRRYLSRLSGPLLDRIDIIVPVHPLRYKELSMHKEGASSEEIRERVIKARKKQQDRLQKEEIRCNAQMNTASISKHCKLDKKTQSFLERIYTTFHLSNRAYHKILKVARTIADLEDKEEIQQNHIIEAVQYRKFLQEEIV